MSERYFIKIAAELGISIKQVDATAQLLQEGSTVPFIARYRKELTGSLDEVQITAIRDRLEQLEELDKRRETILKSIKEQGKLTAELEQKNPRCRNNECFGRFVPAIQTQKTYQSHHCQRKRTRTTCYAHFGTRKY